MVILALWAGVSFICCTVTAISTILCYVTLKRTHEAELSRLVFVFESSMSYLRANSATDKVAADTSRKSADLQLKILEDELARNRAGQLAQEEENDPPKRIVHGIDSEGKTVEINLNDGWQIQE
jgi:hypothetical protein